MVFEFDPFKDRANLAKHRVGLAHAKRVFDDPDRLVVPTIRIEDEEERFKAIGEVDHQLWTAIHVYRGERVRLISVRGATPLKRDDIIAIEADPGDEEDRPVSEAALQRAQMGRRIRKLRASLDLSQAEFASRFGIPLANIRQYEIGRTMPPPAVRSFLKVIAADPDRAAAALAQA